MGTKAIKHWKKYQALHTSGPQIWLCGSTFTGYRMLTSADFPGNRSGVVSVEALILH